MTDFGMAKLAAQHKGALARYLDATRGPTGDPHSHVESELASIERAMMVPPPFVPPGLVTADEARAAATPEGLIELNTLSLPVRLRMRDAYPGIPESEWAEKIRDKKAVGAENRGLVKHTLDQNGFGSCAGHGGERDVHAARRF